MKLAGQEIRNYAREQRDQAKLDQALDHLRALEAILDRVEQDGGYCEGCGKHISHEHESDCPRQAAQEYLDGLE